LSSSSRRGIRRPATAMVSTVALNGSSGQLGRGCGESCEPAGREHQRKGGSVLSSRAAIHDCSVRPGRAAPSSPGRRASAGIRRDGRSGGGCGLLPAGRGHQARPARAGEPPLSGHPRPTSRPGAATDVCSSVASHRGGHSARRPLSVNDRQKLSRGRWSCKRPSHRRIASRPRVESGCPSALRGRWLVRRRRPAAAGASTASAQSGCPSTPAPAVPAGTRRSGRARSRDPSRPLR
jgi:hypothetical protein